MEETGPDRIRAAIERARGMDAPAFPVNVCGPGCRGEVAPAEPRPLPDMEPLRLRDLVADWLFCPGCFCLRFGPGHLSRKLFGVDCNHV